MIKRGVRGVGANFSTGQVTLDTEVAEVIIEAVNGHYPGRTNGSLKGALTIIAEDYLEIPQEITPADAQTLMRQTGTDTICKALVQLALKALHNGNAKAGELKAQ